MDIIRCTICLGPIWNNAVALSCNHFFHFHCLFGWLAGNKKSCPNCRQDCKITQVCLSQPGYLSDLICQALEQGAGEWDESVTSYQFDPHIIHFGESMQLTSAFENGTLSTVYQPPPSIEPSSVSQLPQPTLPRPDLSISDLERPSTSSAAVSASLEVHPNTPPLEMLADHELELDLTSSESSGQLSNNDELFDTTPDLSDAEAQLQSDIEESNSPIIHRRLNISLASSTSSAISDSILSEMDENMEDQSHQR